MERTSSSVHWVSLERATTKGESNSTVRRVAPCCASTSCRARWPRSLCEGRRPRGSGSTNAVRSCLIRGRPRRLACWPAVAATTSRKFHVLGSETDGHSVAGRLNHVLPAAAAHAATDEADGGQSPPGPQFADHIDQQDRCGRTAGGSRPAGCAAARPVPIWSSIWATSSNRSGCRGTTISRAVGAICAAVRGTSRPPAALPDPEYCRRGTRTHRRARCHS